MPDPTIFEVTRFKAESIEQRLHETAYLNPNLTIIFENKRDSKEPVVFKEPEGIRGLVETLTKGKESLTDTIYMSGEKDGISVEFAFKYTSEYGDNIMGFCNNIYTEEGGTHINGFKAGFAKLINQYARDLGTLKEKDANFTGNDTRNGMTCIISIKHPTPRFEGQKQNWITPMQIMYLQVSLTQKDNYFSIEI